MTAKELAHNPIITRIVEWFVIVLVSVISIYATLYQTVADVKEITPMVRKHETDIKVLDANLCSIKEQLNRIENKIDRVYK